MPCYGCGTSFGTFKKEKGCKNCGFSFCSKCLPQKTKIPKLNNETHHVCLKCFNILTGKVKPSQDTAKYSPPANFVKRVEALKEREVGGAQPVVLKDHGGGRAPAQVKAKYKGMSKADIDIAQRLEKLKEKPPDQAAAKHVTNQEIDQRLAVLKGMDPRRYSTDSKPKYHAPERRTQQEQLDDLLHEIADEVDLESKLPDPAQEIASRLARLREDDKPSSTTEGDNSTAQTKTSDENNLNRKTEADTKPFSQNIGGGNVNQHNPVSPDKPSNEGSEEGEVSVEEMNKILNEAARELEMDAQKAIRDLEQDKEIMKKLQEVKQRRKESSADVNKDEGSDRSDSENEETDEAAADRIIKQFVEETKLDEAAAKDGTDPETTAVKPKQKVKQRQEEEYEDEDELPYCCICTEDATVRCFDCDRDLYCNTCFREGHRDLGLEDHRSARYIPPKGKT